MMRGYHGHTVITRGNVSKLGDDIACSGHAGGPGKCLGACGSCLRLCYAHKGNGRYPNVMESREKNYLIVTASPLEWFVDHDDYIMRRCPPFFRFNEDGDFTSQEHFDLAVRLAAFHPGVAFASYTKRWRGKEPLQLSGMPDNFQLLYSLWPDMRERPPEGARIAYTIGKQDRVPTGAELCPGSCSGCKLCFEKSSRHVAFRIH